MARKMTREFRSLTRPLRLLVRAIRRVPRGPELDRQAWQGKTWDANTGLFLPRR